MLLSGVDEMKVNSERPYDIDSSVQFTIIYDACDLSIQGGNFVFYSVSLSPGDSPWLLSERLGTLAQAFAALPQLLHDVKDGDPIVSLYGPPQSVT